MGLKRNRRLKFVLYLKKTKHCNSEVQVQDSDPGCSDSWLLR